MCEFNTYNIKDSHHRGIHKTHMQHASEIYTQCGISIHLQTSNTLCCKPSRNNKYANQSKTNISKYLCLNTHISSIKLHMLSGLPVITSYTSSGFGWRKRRPDMEGSGGYAEQDRK